MTFSAWLIEHWGLIATFLWATCELLNQIPSIKANTVATLIINGVLSIVRGKVIERPVINEPPK